MDRVDQRGFDNQHPEHISAGEAARLLGVKLQTLYAYASRGLVHSVPGPSGGGRLYLRADLTRLKARHQARAGHGPVAAGALRWGEPVLSTTISAIRDTGPVYRGHPAVELARRGVSFEAVAELLWTGVLDEEVEGWTDPGLGEAVRRARAGVARARGPLEGLLAAVPRLALFDRDRFAARPEAEWVRARRLVRALAAVVGDTFGNDLAARASRESGVAASLAVSLGASRRRREAIDLALVLMADHELNVSTFAARVVASTGADVYACLAGALAAATGPLHGAASDRVEALLEEVGSPRRVREVLHARASRGDAIPGFGHPLYPQGDPRVGPLLEVARSLDDRSDRRATPLAIVDAMERAGREPPNVDFALVVLARALGLPRGAASAIFVIGRTAGWVAHALEQRQAGYLLRPRAEYVGP